MCRAWFWASEDYDDEASAVDNHITFADALRGDAGAVIAEEDAEQSGSLAQVLSDTVGALILQRVGDDGTEQQTIAASALLSAIQDRLLSHCSEKLQAVVERQSSHVALADTIANVQSPWSELEDDAALDARAKWFKEHFKEFGAMSTQTSKCEEMECPELLGVAKELQKEIQALASQTCKEQLHESVQGLQELSENSGVARRLLEGQTL